MYLHACRRTGTRAWATACSEGGVCPVESRESVANPRSPAGPQTHQTTTQPVRTYCTYTVHVFYQCYVYSLLRPRHSHRRQSSAWPFERVAAARRRNGCGSPRGTETTGPSGLDRRNASVGSCVQSRSFGRWWRGVPRTRHCWPQVSSSPLSHGLCGQRSCLPSLAVRG